MKVNRYIITSFFLLITGLAYLSASVWLAYWKPPNTDEVFIAYPVGVFVISTSIIGLLKKEKSIHWLIEKPLRFYLIVLAVAFLVIVPLGLQYGIDYKNDVLVEAHGILFDLLVFGVLLAIYDKLKEDNYKRKKLLLKIEEFRTKIDDFRHLRTDESKFQIRSYILFLNKKNCTDIDLSYLNLTSLDMKEVIFDNSNLFKTNFSGTNLHKSSFKNIICHTSKFNGNKTFLNRVDFSGANIQNSEFIKTYLNAADFSNATLSKVDFSGADLRNVNFQNTYFFGPTFEGAEVNSDFIEKLKTCNISGHKIYDWFEIKKKPVFRVKDKFQYFIKEKTDIDKTVSVEL